MKIVFIIALFCKIIIITRMHSSRMHIVRCSGRLSCHCHPHPCLTCPPAMHTPCHACPPAMHTPCHACLPCYTCPLPCTPLPCMPPAMHTPCHACLPCYTCPLPCTPPAMHALPCHTCPHCHTCPPDRILGTHLWKQYLSAPTVADANNDFFPYISHDF